MQLLQYPLPFLNMDGRLLSAVSKTLQTEHLPDFLLGKMVNLQRISSE
jgi:hypothetical protein